MNLSDLQADLRHFAAERDWQPFHTPKNLSTALMVEAAELTEIFQWMTPEESATAHVDRATKQRIGEEVADVLLYLLQVADHSQIDIERAVKDKLLRNALKHPAKRTIPRLSLTPAEPLGTHVLLDFENVQPTEGEVRGMVPDARHLWVFHGPHQRKVEQRFASFDGDVTAVPISRTGKNALDFHLSFYMGYLAARHQASPIVVVANDTGYDPVLEHARAMAFAVRRQEHGQAQPASATRAATPAAKKSAAKKVTAKSAGTKQTLARKATGKGAVAPAAKKASPPGKANAVHGSKPRLKTATVTNPPAGSKVRASPHTVTPSGGLTPISIESLGKVIANLRSMGDKRPAKAASLRRALKSLLAVETGDPAIELALGQLFEGGVVSIDATSGVSYPGFA